MNWQAIIDKINNLVAKIQQKLQELIDKINSILSKVPGFLSWMLDGFKALWNKMLAKLDDFWNWLDAKLQYMGNVPWLDDSRNSWQNDVGQPTYDETKNLQTDPDLLVDDDDRWQGSAAEAYRSKAPEQVQAMDKISQTFVTAIASSLQSVKTGLLIFWAGIAIALVTLLGAFILALGSAATVVGAVASPEFIIGGIIAFLIAGASGLLGLKLNMDTAAQSLNTALRYHTDPWPSFALQ